MRRTIRLRESELKHMISESVKRIISEGVHRYKGFKCVNVSNDPSFPSYAIISPEGKTIDKTLFPSEMKEIVDNYLKKGNLNEAIDPVGKIQSLIQQANDAYHNVSDMQDNDEWPLMDKQGNPYGLSGDIKLDGRGYVTIPLNGGSYSGYEPTKIRVLRKVGDKVQIIKGDYYEEGWKDVAKILKKIIKDAEIGIGNFKEYDPNWETSDSPEEFRTNKSALRKFNKKIGRNSSAGMDYLSEGKLNSIVSKSLRKVLKEWADDYEGNDLDYETIKMEAEDAIFKMQEQGQIMSWRIVAENMGFRLDTLNGEDMELLKDTIEEVMMENDIQPEDGYGMDEDDLITNWGEHNYDI